MDKGTAFRQIVLIGVNNLCHSAGRICTQQKKGVTLSDYTFFDNALKSVYFIPSAP